MRVVSVRHPPKNLIIIRELDKLNCLILWIYRRVDVIRTLREHTDDTD